MTQFHRIPIRLSAFVLALTPILTQAAATPAYTFTPQQTLAGEGFALTLSPQTGDCNTIWEGRGL